jgi:glycosyltransferase involved in cell wall biosynthesis
MLARVSPISEHRIAVLIPCYNEEKTVAQVVADFRAALPEATIYVYDNNSNDRTAEMAAAAGAEVRAEPRQGKGHVVRRMFAEVDADAYLLVDGDSTYDAAAARTLVRRLLDHRLDMVNAARVTPRGSSAYRPGHALGNRSLTGAVRMVFGQDFRDMLSGYKVFSRRFVRSFPAMSRGFEIETEFTIHALELQMPCAEVTATYRERPTGSASKLNTFRDGFRILFFIVRLCKDERPLAFFGLLGVISMLAGLALGVPVVMEFLRTGLVPKLPSAVLAAALANLGVLLVIAGLILDLVTKARREIRRLAYLAVPPRS